MGFFQKIGGAFARFMYGRNGWDQLNQALFRGYLALWIAEIVCGLLRWGLAARVLEAVLFSLMLIIFFRMFSKDLYRRRTENQKWVNWYCGMAAGPGQGAQVFHLQAVQDHLPGPGGQGEDRHHLSQVRGADPGEDLRKEDGPRVPFGFVSFAVSSIVYPALLSTSFRSWRSLRY